MKEIAKNLKSCINKNSDNLLCLREMRKGTYIPTPTLDYFNTFDDVCIKTKKQKSVLEGIRLALMVWSNHQHLLEEDEYASVFIDEENIKENVYYTHTFGYLLYLLSKTYSDQEEWENKMNKFKKASGSLIKLVQFIILTIKESVNKGIKIKLDYSYLAYIFSQSYLDKTKISDFLSDTFWSFQESKNKDL
jgi:hypothetical protein